MLSPGLIRGLILFVTPDLIRGLIIQSSAYVSFLKGAGSPHQARGRQARHDILYIMTVTPDPMRGLILFVTPDLIRGLI